MSEQLSLDHLWQDFTHDLAPVPPISPQYDYVTRSELPNSSVTLSADGATGSLTPLVRVSGYIHDDGLTGTMTEGARILNAQTGQITGV